MPMTAATKPSQTMHNENENGMGWEWGGDDPPTHVGPNDLTFLSSP